MPSRRRLWNQGPSRRIFSAISEEGGKEERGASEDMVEVSGVIPAKDASAVATKLKDGNGSGSHFKIAERIEREAELRSNGGANPIGVADKSDVVGGILCEKG